MGVMTTDGRKWVAALLITAACGSAVALDIAITLEPDGPFLEARGPLIRDSNFADLQRHDVGRLDATRWGGAAWRCHPPA